MTPREGLTLKRVSDAIGLLVTAFSDGTVGYGSGALINGRNLLTCAHELDRPFPPGGLNQAKPPSLLKSRI